MVQESVELVIAEAQQEAPVKTGFLRDSDILLVLDGDVYDDRSRGDAIFGSATGSGIGDLNVYVRVGDEDTKIWGLSGDAGNNWYMAQAPVSSTSDFRIVFEGVVGRNSLGNIAVDDVSIMPGVCPSKGPLRGRKKMADDPSLQLIFFFPL